MSFWDYLFPTAEDFKMGKSPDVRRRWRSKSRCLVYTGDKIQSKDISVLQCALDLGQTDAHSSALSISSVSSATPTK